MGDLVKAAAAVTAATKILVTSHIRPDGDSAGSVAAMCHLLRQMGKEVHPLFLSRLPGWYEFLFENSVPVLGRDVPESGLDAKPYSECDLVIVVDTNSANQLPVFVEWLKKTKKKLVVIDHHIREVDLGAIEVVDDKASAAGLVLYEFAKQAGWKIDGRTANCLFAAIGSDTGWFRYGSVNGRTLRAAAELVEAGARPGELYKSMLQNYSKARMRLLVRLLGSMKLYKDGRVAVAYLRKSDFAETGATWADTENMIDECQRIATVEAVVMLSEQEEGGYRCSLRSRGKVDVQKIAAGYGGGGHKQASGVTMDMELQQAADSIRKLIEEQLG